MSTRRVARSPSTSVPSACSFTVPIGSALAAAIARLSLAICAPVVVSKKSWVSPNSSARARIDSSSSSCSVSVGGFFGVVFGLLSATFFVAGAGALLAESPQAAMSAAAAINMVQRGMATSEGTVSEIPVRRADQSPSDAKLVR